MVVQSDQVAVQLTNQAENLTDAIEKATAKTSTIVSAISTETRNLGARTDGIMTQVKEAGEVIKEDTKDAGVD